MNEERDALYWRVLTRLIESVRDGTYPAGARLGSESMLAREFGVSRAVVAKALLILRHYGLVVGPGGGRTFVAAEPMRTMALGALLTTDDIRRWNGQT
jgi:GntR family transcriptional regulator, histidine utilization repressor